VVGVNAVVPGCGRTPGASHHGAGTTGEHHGCLLTGRLTLSPSLST